MSGTWCLAIHAGWRCRQSGACCRAGWAIPVEWPQFEALAALRGRGDAAAPRFLTGGPLPAGAAAILGRRSSGSCVFLDEADRGLCEIHRDFGPELLPVACQQFPRIVLHDGRGRLVTLSHFCPTAASLLVAGGELEVVGAPPNIARTAAEGLDATDVLPPLVRPGLLTDLDGYAAWERCGIRALWKSRGTAWTALETIGAATRVVEAWSPSDGALREAVHRAFAAPGRVQEAEPDFRTALDRSRLATASVHAGLAPPALTDDLEREWTAARRVLRRHDAAVRAYLAARLFGNWMAYSAPGLQAVVEYLRVALSVLEVETARQHIAPAGRPSGPPLADRHRRSASGGDSAPVEDVRIFTEAVRQTDLLLVHLCNHRKLAVLIGRR